MEKKNLILRRPLKRQRLILRRPLGCICLGVIFVLFLFTELRGHPKAVCLSGNRKNVTISGTVTRKEAGKTPEKAYQIIYLKTDKAVSTGVFNIDWGSWNKSVPDSVICYLDTGQKVPEIGSHVKVTGQREDFESASNPGQFDSFFYYQILKISYRLYQTKILTKSMEYSEMQEAFYQARQYLGIVLDRALPEKEAGVMKTMLLGEKGAIDRDLKALYQRNGIAHILAISGVKTELLAYGKWLKDRINTAFVGVFIEWNYIAFSYKIRDMYETL